MSQEKAKDSKGKDQAKRDEIPDAELDKVSGGIIIQKPTTQMEAEDTDEFRPTTSGFGDQEFLRKGK